MERVHNGGLKWEHRGSLAVGIGLQYRVRKNQYGALLQVLQFSEGRQGFGFDSGWIRCDNAAEAKAIAEVIDVVSVLKEGEISNDLVNDCLAIHFARVHAVEQREENLEKQAEEVKKARAANRAARGL